MTIYTEQHYWDMIRQNPGATVGFVLAARAIYAAKNGVYDTRDGNSPKVRNLALNVANRYGEALTTDDLRIEMDIQKVNKYEQRT